MAFNTHEYTNAAVCGDLHAADGHVPEPDICIMGSVGRWLACAWSSYVSWASHM